MESLNSNSSNWMRFFEDVIAQELQCLNRLNFSVNRDSVDSNEFNLRFEFETRRLPIFQFNSSFNTSFNSSNWSLNFESATVPMSSTYTPTTTGLSLEIIEQSSVKYIITNETECHICLDILLKGSCMRKLNHCQHSYCIDCIYQWLRHNNTCPLCKSIVH